MPSIHSRKINLRSILFLCLSYLSLELIGQQKLGSEIIGNMSGDSLGYAIALSDNGQRMIIGVPGNDTNGIDAGQALIYEESSGSWILLETLNGTSAGDQFGFSVAMDTTGTRVIIGAPYSSSSTGYAQIWEESGGIWSQVYGDISGTSAGDEFGYAVDMSCNGNFVAISAPEKDTRGSGFRYQDNGSSWNLLFEITSPTSGNWPPNVVRHGHSIAISGNGERIAVGAPNSYPNLSGAARIFGTLSNGSYGRMFTARPAFDNDFGGRSVSLSYDGKIVAVGVIGHGSTATSTQGRVLIYEQTGALTDANRGFIFRDEVIGFGSMAEFGSSVDLSEDGQILGVGSRNFGYGTANAFTYDAGSSSWNFETTLAIEGTDSSPFLGPYFGQSVSLVGNINNIRFAIGAPAGTNPIVTTQQPEGAAVVYEKVSTPLPVELVNFQAIKKRTSINLQWQTASELNNAGFEVQKSANGVSWKTLDWIDGHGTINEVINYQYIDEHPLHGANYYRLKQIDWDGQFELSETILMQFEGTAPTLQIYPNPTTNNTIYINGSFPGQQLIKVEVFDLSGKPVIKRKIQLEEPANGLSFQLAEGIKGVYILSIEYLDQRFSQRFIVE